MISQRLSILAMLASLTLIGCSDEKKKDQDPRDERRVERSEPSCQRPQLKYEFDNCLETDARKGKQNNWLGDELRMYHPAGGWALHQTDRSDIEKLVQSLPKGNSSVHIKAYRDGSPRHGRTEKFADYAAHCLVSAIRQYEQDDQCIDIVVNDPVFGGRGARDRYTAISSPNIIKVRRKSRGVKRAKRTRRKPQASRSNTECSLQDGSTIEMPEVTYLTASWCGACKVAKPRLGKASKRTGVSYISLSIDHEPGRRIYNALRREIGIIGIPVVVADCTAYQGAMTQRGYEQILRSTLKK